jgi:hypothetical protein
MTRNRVTAGLDAACPVTEHESPLTDGSSGQTISAIGAAVFNGIRAYAEQHNIQIEGLPEDPRAEIPPEQALHIIHNFLAIQFPLLHPAVPSPAASL